MRLNKSKSKSTMRSNHDLENTSSTFTHSPMQGVPPRHPPTLTSSQSTVIQGQPSLSSLSTNKSGNTVDDTSPHYHQYQYPQEQEQEQEQLKQQHPPIVKRKSHSVRYPSSTPDSSIITTNVPSAKTGQHTASKPLPVYDESVVPPIPPIHGLNKNNFNDGASDHSQKSSGSGSSKNNNNNSTPTHQSKRYDEKTEEERRRVEKITKDYRDMEGHNREIENMIRYEDDKFNRISRQFHHDTMEVRATDEDYSTIHNSLTILQAKIASLPLSLKQYLIDKQEVTNHFVKRWPHLEPAITHLCKRKQPDSTALDNVIISQLIEKLVTEKLVEFVHQSPVHVGFPANDAYLQLIAVMNTAGHPDLSLRLCQQLCKITARATTHNDTGLPSDVRISQSVSEQKAVIIATIVDELIHFYNDPQNPNKCSDELMTKIHRILESAAEVSLAMRSQVNPVIPLATEYTEGKNVFDPEIFTMQNGSAQDASTIQVIICPPFVFHEDDQQILTMKGKAICF